MSSDRFEEMAALVIGDRYNRRGVHGQRTRDRIIKILTVMLRKADVDGTPGYCATTYGELAKLVGCSKDTVKSDTYPLISDGLINHVLTPDPCDMMPNYAEWRFYFLFAIPGSEAPWLLPFRKGAS